MFSSCFGQMTWIHLERRTNHNKGSATTHSNQNSTNETPLRPVQTPSNKSANLYRNNMMSTPSSWQCLHYIRVANKWAITIGKCVHNSLCALPLHIEHDYIPKICWKMHFPPSSHKWASLFMINLSTFLTFPAFITTTTVFPNWHK